ncbi:MAG: hypothetical protein AAGK78_14065, partial [Planctomycetota bacterium]
TGLSGDAGPIATFGDVEVVAENAGQLYLGFKGLLDDNVVRLENFDQINVIEGSTIYTGPTFDGAIEPGLYVLDSSIGAFNYGGVVTGNVLVQGSVGTFTAGAILTGDITGAGLGREDNFAIFGDVDAIVAATSIGDTETEDAGPIVDPGGTADEGFFTGTDIAIGGNVGMIRAGGSIVASAEIRGDQPTGPDFDFSSTFYAERTQAYTEYEVRVPGTARDTSFGAGQPAIAALDNDTFDTYEPVGARNDGTLTINGSLTFDPITPVIDQADYFGVGIMAGQRFEVQLDAGGPFFVGVFDPDGRLVATDYDDNPSTAVVRTGGRFQVLAETAGIYRVVVGLAGDLDFNEVGPVNASGNYTLNLSGLGDLTVGGIKANSRIWGGAAVALDA